MTFQSWIGLVYSTNMQYEIIQKIIYGQEKISIHPDYSRADRLIWTTPNLSNLAYLV